MYDAMLRRKTEQDEDEDELKHAQHEQHQHEQAKRGDLYQSLQWHKIMIDEFRVTMCHNYVKGVCKLPASFCFDSHDPQVLRRKPVQGRGNRFNYCATMCIDVLLGKTCPRGNECTFAHNRLERRYHPSLFRTQMCPHYHDGVSAHSDVFCSYAHGDLREVSPPRYSYGDIMSNYKVWPCDGLGREQCTCRNFNYHDSREQRRPLNIGYLPRPCPAAKPKDDDEWQADVCCDPQCKCAHSRFEVMFHPRVYKSVLCSFFTETGFCRFGVFCAHAHGFAELRRF